MHLQLWRPLKTLCNSDIEEGSSFYFFPYQITKNFLSAARIENNGDYILSTYRL